MKWFKSKKQVEALKTIPLLESELPVSKTLKLSSLMINYSVTQVDPYCAYIEYKEYPKKWSDSGNQVSNIEIKAKSWAELIDKVLEHFESVSTGSNRSK